MKLQGGGLFNFILDRKENRRRPLGLSTRYFLNSMCIIGYLCFHSKIMDFLENEEHLINKDLFLQETMESMETSREEGPIF